MLAELRGMHAAFLATPVPPDVSLEDFVMRDVFGQGLPLMLHDLEHHAPRAGFGGAGTGTGVLGSAVGGRIVLTRPPIRSNAGGNAATSANAFFRTAMSAGGGGGGGGGGGRDPGFSMGGLYAGWLASRAPGAGRRPPPPAAVPACDTTGAYPVSDVNADGAPGTECCVCYAAAANMTLSPCGHSVLCRACALRMRAEGINKCPVCNVAIERVLPLLLGTVAAAAATTVAAAAAPATTTTTTTTTAPAGAATWRDLDLAEDEACARRLQAREFGLSDD